MATSRYITVESIRQYHPHKYRIDGRRSKTCCAEYPRTFPHLSAPFRTPSQRILEAVQKYFRAKSIGTLKTGVRPSWENLEGQPSMSQSLWSKRGGKRRWKPPVPE
ncbi:uncharacterized protein EAF01_011998 [Botrytis porri]|uniref:uncharacterized protein n=1 Tax=Botrytis porri TaxID=87229 RepID=UPI0018FF1BA8|nr:uncharacterized protein EAF01_011998 [Botrytis porri]KAF7880237.1 hypothetical protein EAF01_011998 [Botrytis porri]